MGDDVDLERLWSSTSSTIARRAKERTNSTYTQEAHIMGKVNKRQRKFLSKGVLPHRKRGGVRRDAKLKGNNKRGGKQQDAAAPATGDQQPQRRTLPDGLDAATFLECAWLSEDACAAAGRDACVALLEPAEEAAALLPPPPEVVGQAAALKGGGPKKRARGSKSDITGGLAEKTARAMVTQAVESEAPSIDDVLCGVRALQQNQAAAARWKNLSTAAPAAAAAAAGTHAYGILLDEAFSRLHLAFCAHLGPERDEGDSAEEWEDRVRAHGQQLERAEAWPQLGGALLSFLTAALEHLLEVNEAKRQLMPNAGAASGGSGSGGAALARGLSRMKYHVPLLFPFQRLARRYLVFLLGLLEASDDQTVLSLAFLRLYELSTSQPMPFLHDAFKGAYRCYRAAAERVGAGKGTAAAVANGSGGGGAGPLPLLRECFSELFGVGKSSAYLHAYVYIHDLAREALAAAAEVQKAGGRTREAGPALRRLRSWGFLQSLLLWTSVVAANSAKSALGPLVPPLAKVLEITLQLSPGLYGAPRTLALARGAQDLAAAAGVFLPTSHHLVGLLELLHAHKGRPCPTATAAAADGRNPADGDGPSSTGEGGEAEQVAATMDAGGKGSSGSKKRRRGGQAAAAAAAAAVDLSAVAGLGKEDLKLGEVHSAVAMGAVALIAREAVCYRWSAGLPELCAGAGARLGRMLEGGYLPVDGGAGKCRSRVRALQAALGKAEAEAVARRARGSKHPGEAGPVDTFRGMEDSTATQRLLAFKEPC